ncbi:FAD-dependent oxidoreductase [Thermodesulfobacteriota bacterium]
MHRIVFARWGEDVEDFRTQREETDKPLPETFPDVGKFPDNLAAVMCGKGFIQLDQDFNFVSMIREYVRQIQAEYCCGRCLIGIKGTKMLLVSLEKIAEGKGEQTDLELLERVGTVLDDAAKCSICQSSGELVKMGLTQFKKDFDKAIESGVPEDSTDYMAKISAPCMTTCPCHINVPGYIEALQEIRYEDALSIIREEMPLPGITGRVCPAPCQEACTLANVGTAPIPIRILKRVAADYEMNHKLEPPLPKKELTGAPVAVVGAGPAGLTTAYYLNQLGHQVTIFEALPVSGGMVGVGIPPYRQPRRVLQRDIDIILELGVKLEEGKRLGKHFSIQDLFDKGFKAVFLGVGSHKSISMGIKGEEDDLIGVFSGGIDFLRDLNLGEEVTIGDKVIIVGGGNTAIDCARTTLRMGASEVHVVYRRTEKEMPADLIEVEDAREEGVQFHFLTQPLEVLSEDNKMTGLRCIEMELGEPDWSGRRRPVPKEGSEFDMEGDTIIPAIGQKAQLDFLSPDEGIEITRWGTFKVDEGTMMTTRPGVFAAGDAVSGPLTVVHGVAGGKLAGRMIHDYVTHGKCQPPADLKMQEILAIIEKDPGVTVTPASEGREGGKTHQTKLDMRQRLETFDEVETGFTQQGSYVESSRCLRCYHLVMVATRD